MTRPHHLSLGRRFAIFYWPDGDTTRWVSVSRKIGVNRGVNLVLYGKRFNVQVIYVLRFVWVRDAFETQAKLAPTSEELNR